MKSQAARILRALERGDKLTPITALNRFECFRLGARIHDLKASGRKIATRLVKRNGKRVAEYSLK